MDDETCEECRKFDGFSILPSKVKDYCIPIPDCKSPDCRCQIMPTFWDQGTTVSTDREGKEVTYHEPGDAADIVAFLEHSGGVATSAQIDAYIDAQLAPLRKEREREHANVELWQRAYRTEKESPDKSIPLYRESIQAWKTVGVRWDYLEDSYNRLTLTLEKLGRFPEALREIDGYRAFCLEKGRNTLLNTIVKREARLKKKVLRSK